MSARSVTAAANFSFHRTRNRPIAVVLPLPRPSALSKLKKIFLAIIFIRRVRISYRRRRILEKWRKCVKLASKFYRGQLSNI